MGARARSTGGRIQPLGALAGLAVAALLAWPVVVHGLSEASMKMGQADAALRLDPSSEPASAELSAEALSKNRPDLAAALARNAIAATPLSAAGIRMLALTRQNIGDLTGAAKLMAAGSSMGWRDGVTQLWIASAALQAKDFGQSAMHTDALARTVGMNDPTRELVDALASSREGRAAVADRLAHGSDWRMHYFLDGGIDDVQNLVAQAQLLAALAGTSGPPTPPELRNLTDRLVNTDQDRVAYRLWQVVRHADGTAPSDGGFDHIAADQGDASVFDWRLYPVAGSTATVEDVDGGHALHATSDGTASGTIARQTLMLAPGPHHFTADVRYGSAASADGFRWMLDCASTEIDVGTPTLGKAYAFDFEVPDDPDCASQTLQLMARRVDAPGQIDAWFGHVAIH